MNLVIHRGTHEIGGSCVELESNGSRIVIDMGIPLVNPDGTRFNIKDYNDFPDQELAYKNIIPNVKGIYKFDRESEPIDGLIISHPHTDHFGFYNYISPEVPVYLGEATNELIRIISLFGPQNKGSKQGINNSHFFKKKNIYLW